MVGMIEHDSVCTCISERLGDDSSDAPPGHIGIHVLSEEVNVREQQASWFDLGDGQGRNEGHSILSAVQLCRREKFV